MTPTPCNGVKATAHGSPMLLPAVAAMAAVTVVATPAAVAAPVTVPLCFAEPEDVHDPHIFHLSSDSLKKTSLTCPHIRRAHWRVAVQQRARDSRRVRRLGIEVVMVRPTPMLCPVGP